VLGVLRQQRPQGKTSLAESDLTPSLCCRGLAYCCRIFLGNCMGFRLLLATATLSYLSSSMAANTGPIVSHPYSMQ
jgi:hypothetical protein